MADKEELAEVAEAASAKLLVVLVAKLAAVATMVELLDTLLIVLEAALLVVLTPASIEVLDALSFETVDSVELEATSLVATRAIDSRVLDWALVCVFDASRVLDATSLEEINAELVELLGSTEVKLDETPTALATRGDVADALELPEVSWFVEEVLAAVIAGVAEDELLMLSGVEEVEAAKDVLLSTSELEFVELALLDVGNGGMLGVALLEIAPVAVVVSGMTLDKVDETLCTELSLEVLAIVTVVDTDDKLLPDGVLKVTLSLDSVLLDVDADNAFRARPLAEALVYIDAEESLKEVVVYVDEDESLEEGPLLDEALLDADDDCDGASNLFRAGSLLDDAAPVGEEEGASDITVLLEKPLPAIGEGVTEMELLVDDALLDVDGVDATKIVESDAVDENVPVVGLLPDTVLLEVNEDSTFKFALLPADASVNIDEKDKPEVDIDDVDTIKLDPLLVVLLKVLDNTLLAVNDGEESKLRLLLLDADEKALEVTEPLMEVDERVLTMFVLLALDRAEDEALWVKLLLNDVVDEDLTTGSRLPDVDDDEAADIELLPDADRASAGTPLIPTELILDADDEATAAETVDNENVDPETVDNKEVE
ncbi:hypothetical protein LTR28_006370 [Elasticomyces elasticus]|nr:hypothetical protein LTR28_006370 [Elasticomyces elasticus]